MSDSLTELSIQMAKDIYQFTTGLKPETSPNKVEKIATYIFNCSSNGALQVEILRCLSTHNPEKEE